MDRIIMATNVKSIDDNDWNIKYDQDGKTIEESLPMIELLKMANDWMI